MILLSSIKAEFRKRETKQKEKAHRKTFIEARDNLRFAIVSPHRLVCAGMCALAKSRADRSF